MDARAFFYPYESPRCALSLPWFPKQSRPTNAPAVVDMPVYTAGLCLLSIVPQGPLPVFCRNRNPIFVCGIAKHKHTHTAQLTRLGRALKDWKWFAILFVASYCIVNCCYWIVFFLWCWRQCWRGFVLILSYLIFVML